MTHYQIHIFFHPSPTQTSKRRLQLPVIHQHLHHILHFNQHIFLPINLHLLLQMYQLLILHYICFNLQIYLHITTINPTAIPIEKSTDNSEDNNDEIKVENMTITFGFDIYW